jgi:hypothetical protein
MTPQEHYNTANACMELISQHRDNPEFGTEKAKVLAESAQAHALLGILQCLDKMQHWSGGRLVRP